jgi:hypothetical protein
MEESLTACIPSPDLATERVVLQEVSGRKLRDCVPRIGVHARTPSEASARNNSHSAATADIKLFRNGALAHTLSW